LRNKEPKEKKVAPKDKEIIYNPDNKDEFYVVGQRGRLPKWLTLAIENGSIENPQKEKKEPTRKCKNFVSKKSKEAQVIRPSDGYKGLNVWNYIGSDGIPRQKICVIATSRQDAITMINDATKNIYTDGRFVKEWKQSSPTPFKFVIEEEGEGLFQYNNSYEIWQRVKN